ncbi:MAG: hypothetical protein JW712_07395 [Dehalococcoidales bacterium]|nr:hypothetical protein [Dehalococcoidales bacterium]
MWSERSVVDNDVADKTCGMRQHCLRWKTPDTRWIQESLGLLYDKTLCFADRIRFCCGICLPHKFFDEIKYCEPIPLVVIVGSLQTNTHMALQSDITCEKTLGYISGNDAWNSNGRQIAE